VEDKREPVRVLMPGKGWVAAELLYEREGCCRVQVPGDKPRTVLASRVKRDARPTPVVAREAFEDAARKLMHEGVRYKRSMHEVT
jgi:hypothetical protein